MSVMETSVPWIGPREAEGVITPHRFTWDEVQKLAASEIFGEATRFELVGGELYDMPEEGFLHVDAVRVLQKWLMATLAQSGAEVVIREPVHFSDGSVVIPDLSVFPPGTRAAEMSAGRASLIIEVADTTLARDRRIKLPRYVDAGCGEVWLIDAQARAMMIYRTPRDGEWSSVARCEPGSSVAPLCAPDMPFDPAALPEA